MTYNQKLPSKNNVVLMTQAQAKTQQNIKTELLESEVQECCIVTVFCQGSNTGRVHGGCTLLYTVCAPWLGLSQTINQEY